MQIFSPRIFIKGSWESLLNLSIFNEKTKNKNKEFLMFIKSETMFYNGFFSTESPKQDYTKAWPSLCIYYLVQYLLLLVGNIQTYCR